MRLEKKKTGGWYMKYQNLWTEYSYRQSNMTRRQPKDVKLIALISIAIVILAVVFAPHKKAEPKIDNLMQEAIASTKEKERVASEKYLKEQQEEYELKRYNKKVEELNANFTKGDWVIITWWRNPETTYIAPKGTSRTGQINKIEGDKVYGTWGDNALTYGEEVWHRCSQKEYLEARKKEQKEKDRKNAPKKKFVSWGLHPSMRK